MASSLSSAEDSSAGDSLTVDSACSLSAASSAVSSSAFCSASSSAICAVFSSPDASSGAVISTTSAVAPASAFSAAYACMPVGMQEEIVITVDNNNAVICLFFMPSPSLSDARGFCNYIIQHSNDNPAVFICHYVLFERDFIGPNSGQGANGDRNSMVSLTPEPLCAYS